MDQEIAHSSFYGKSAKNDPKMTYEKKTRFYSLFLENACKMHRKKQMLEHCLQKYPFFQTADEKRIEYFRKNAQTVAPNYMFFHRCAEIYSFFMIDEKLKKNDFFNFSRFRELPFFFEFITKKAPSFIAREKHIFINFVYL